MIGAAVFMKNNEVTILENIDEKMVEELRAQKNITNLIVCEDAIDWDYGY